MIMKCRNLEELKLFRDIKLIAGKDGLDHVITWVYINQDSSVHNWIHGGELVFITGLENEFSNEKLKAVVEDCIENAASGIVILCSPEHIQSIPENIISLADERAMPLYEMPWQLKLVDVTKEIADTLIMNQFHERSTANFFSELLFSKHISVAAVKNMGIHCGVNVDNPSAMIILCPEFTNQDNYNHSDFENILAHMSRMIENELYLSKFNFVSSVYMNEIFGYLNCSGEADIKKAHDIIVRIAEKFCSARNDIHIYGGIGRIVSGAENFRKSYSDSRKALEIASNSKKNICLTMFSKLGIIRLLTSEDKQEDIKDYCYSVLMPLIDSDKNHGTEYVKTLEMYLESNCSMVKAAESMFIHRNTMVYRIEKIKNMLDIDFNDMNAKTECMNALKIIKTFSFSIADLP